MGFTIQGKLLGRLCTVTYDRGELTGDEFAVESARRRAEALEGQAVGPVCGPYTTTGHLREPLSAAFIISDVFDEVTGAWGDLPEPPPVPDDAIP